MSISEPKYTPVYALDVEHQPNEVTHSCLARFKSWVVHNPVAATCLCVGLVGFALTGSVLGIALGVGLGRRNISYGENVNINMTLDVLSVPKSLAVTTDVSVQSETKDLPKLISQSSSSPMKKGGTVAAESSTPIVAEDMSIRSLVGSSITKESAIAAVESSGPATDNDALTTVSVESTIPREGSIAAEEGSTTSTTEDASIKVSVVSTITKGSSIAAVDSSGPATDNDALTTVSVESTVTTEGSIAAEEGSTTSTTEDLLIRALVDSTITKESSITEAESSTPKSVGDALDALSATSSVTRSIAVEVNSGRSETTEILEKNSSIWPRSYGWAVCVDDTEDPRRYRNTGHRCCIDESRKGGWKWTKGSSAWAVECSDGYTEGDICEEEEGILGIYQEMTQVTDPANICECESNELISTKNLRITELENMLAYCSSQNLTAMFGNEQPKPRVAMGITKAMESIKPQAYIEFSCGNIKFKCCNDQDDNNVWLQMDQFNFRCDDTMSGVNSGLCDSKSNLWSNGEINIEDYCSYLLEAGESSYDSVTTTSRPEIKPLLQADKYSWVVCIDKDKDPREYRYTGHYCCIDESGVGWWKWARHSSPWIMRCGDGLTEGDICEETTSILGKRQDINQVTTQPPLCECKTEKLHLIENLRVTNSENILDYCSSENLTAYFGYGQPKPRGTIQYSCGEIKLKCCNYQNNDYWFLSDFRCESSRFRQSILCDDNSYVWEKGERARIMAKYCHDLLSESVTASEVKKIVAEATDKSVLSMGKVFGEKIRALVPVEDISVSMTSAFPVLKKYREAYCYNNPGETFFYCCRYRGEYRWYKGFNEQHVSIFNVNACSVSDADKEQGKLGIPECTEHDALSTGPSALMPEYCMGRTGSRSVGFN